MITRREIGFVQKRGLQIQSVLILLQGWHYIAGLHHADSLFNIYTVMTFMVTFVMPAFASFSIQPPNVIYF